MPIDVEGLQRTNEARCERLVDRAGLVDAQGIAWDMAPARELDAEAVACLVYMRDVEGFTDRDFVGVIGHPATMADPLVHRFLVAWRAEEAEHARVLDRFLHSYCTGRGQPLPPAQPPPPAVASLAEHGLLTLTRPVGHVVTAMHMVWGAVNELLTMTGYRLLAQRSGHPVLAQLLGRIIAQEARHYSFYMLQAEWRLAASRLARTVVPRLLQQAWTPVGVGRAYKPRSDFDRVLRYLATGEEGSHAVTAMDRTLRRLPGLEGLSIYSTAAAHATATTPRRSPPPRPPGLTRPPWAPLAPPPGPA